MRNYLNPFERKSYDIFNAMPDFERDFFGNFPAMPPMRCKVDIRETNENYILDVELAGFEKEEIKIDINGDNLTISAEHSSKIDEGSKNDNYIRRERSFGKYQQSFDISNVISENIEAEYKNGVLTVTLPKKIPSAPVTRTINIK